jgi:carboxypeptidase family protein
MVSLSPRARVVALIALLAVLNAVTAFSQVVTGAILGRVTDTTGAVLPGATVQIQNVETGFARTEQTDSEGRYLSRNLPLGSYSVTVQQAGFRTEERRGIVLTVASEVTVNVELAVGNIQEKIEVTAEAPTVETTNATVSGLVSPDQIRDLPLNGRNIDTLALLSPGVIANQYGASTGNGLSLSVNGARRDANVYLLDGTVTNDHTTRGSSSVAGQSLGVEGILEFRLLTHSFSAEYGRNSGAIMSSVTRSGTNEFHGSAYEFVRNNIFDARNFFNVGALPPFRRNQFGAALGGRVIKDRMFFFANYEGLRQRQGNTQIAFVPDANARQGLVPNAAGQLQPVTFNPAIKPYLDLYFPLPNGRSFGDGTAEFISSPTQPTTEDYSMERMDFRLSDKDNFYWRYVYDPASTLTPAAVPSFTATSTTTNHFLVLSETHVFSGSSLNEFRTALNRTAPVVVRDVLSGNQPNVPSLAFVPGQPLGGILFALVPGGGSQLTTVGPGLTGTKSRWAQNLFQETDTFSTVRGAHSMKFGVDFERIQLNIFDSGPSSGFYQFGGVLPLLAAQASRFTALLIGGPNSFRNDIIRGWRRTDFGWFVQDDFRLRPNLTLNFGFRHEFFTTPKEVNGKSARMINLTDPQVTAGPPFESHKLNFSPRIGLAWDPTGSGKTSVRLGAGVFYNFLDGRTWYHPANRNSLFFNYISAANPPFPNGVGALQLGQALSATYTYTAHPDEPTVIHYNLEVQRELAPRLSLRAGYVGSYGYHMIQLTSQNIRIPQLLPDGRLFFAANAPFINPGYSDIFGEQTTAHYNYNGFQLVLQKTVSAGLQFQASYTYSKTLSDADETTNSEVSSTAPTPLNIRKLSGDYSLSAYDQRQTLVLNGAYQMPWNKLLTGKLAKAALGGWAINGIYSYGSGLPLNIQTGFNQSRNGDSFQTDRPDLAPGFSASPIHGVTAGCQGIPAGQKLGTPERWYDPCAFVLQSAGTFGNLGRNTVTGPGLSSIDFTLLKSTPLTEQKKLEFRAEFFNLLNHARFGSPNRNIFTSPGLRPGNDATITTTVGSNRQIQLGLKLIF